LTAWLINVAQRSGFVVQSTSVPGVAQRTGATLYYMEFFPKDLTEDGHKMPIMALMPIPGDVDCVLASELLEACRTVERGLVTPDRTLMIASSHRVYTISERSALSNGIVDAAPLTDLLQREAKQLILFDMEEVAERHGSVISAVMLGALAGSGRLPLDRKFFEDAIRLQQLSVETNLAAFSEAFTIAAEQTVPKRAIAEKPAPRESLVEGVHIEIAALLARLDALAPAVRGVALEGLRRLVDYQDPAYASVYLCRLEQLQLAAAASAKGSEELLAETARGLALWMSFEDTFRVADLKTRASRFARIRGEVHADSRAVLSVVDFVKPRVEEITGTLPARLGRWLEASERWKRLLARFTEGRQIKASSVTGFLLLYLLAGMKRWRRRSLRFQLEDERIESWLAVVESLAHENTEFAIAVARSQGLIKGYGETHERGWNNFSRLMASIKTLKSRPDGAKRFERLRLAALADEEGHVFDKEMQEITSSAAIDVGR
jgi:indolepyruvate ferredoxin oxidoreductase, beta subunit